MERGRARARGGRGGSRRRTSAAAASSASAAAAAASSSPPSAQASHADAADASPNNTVNTALPAAAAAAADAGAGAAGHVSNRTTPAAATAAVKTTAATPVSPSAGRTPAAGVSHRGGRAKAAAAVTPMQPGNPPPARMARSEKAPRSGLVQTLLSFSTPSHTAAASTRGSGRRRSTVDVPEPVVDDEGSHSKGGHSLRRRTRVDYSLPDMQEAIAGAAAANAMAMANANANANKPDANKPDATKPDATKQEAIKSDATNPAVSFSSRGRKRKMTSLARGASFGEPEPVTPTAAKRPRLAHKAKETPPPPPPALTGLRRRGTTAGSVIGPGADVSPQNTKTEVMDEIEVAVNSPERYDSDEEEENGEEEPASPSSDESAAVSSPSSSDNSLGSPTSSSPVKSLRARVVGRGRARNRARQPPARATTRRAEAPGLELSQSGVLDDRPHDRLIVHLHASSEFLNTLLPATGSTPEADKVGGAVDQLPVAPEEPSEELPGNNGEASDSISQSDSALSSEPMSTGAQTPQPAESPAADQLDKMPEVKSPVPALKSESSELSDEPTAAAQAEEAQDSDDAPDAREPNPVVKDASIKLEEHARADSGEPKAGQQGDSLDGRSSLSKTAEIPVFASSHPRETLVDFAPKSAPTDTVDQPSQEPISGKSSVPEIAVVTEPEAMVENGPEGPRLAQEPAEKSNIDSAELQDEEASVEPSAEPPRESVDDTHEEPASSFLLGVIPEPPGSITASLQPSEQETTHKGIEDVQSESTKQAVPDDPAEVQSTKADGSLIESGRPTDEPTTEGTTKEEKTKRPLQEREASRPAADALSPDRMAVDERTNNLQLSGPPSDPMVLDEPVEEAAEKSLTGMVKANPESNEEKAFGDQANHTPPPERAQLGQTAATVEPRDQSAKAQSQPDPEQGSADHAADKSAAAAETKQSDTTQDPPAARLKSKSPEAAEEPKDVISQAPDYGLTPTVESNNTPPQLIEDTAPTPTRSPTPSSPPISSVYQPNRTMAPSVDGEEPALRFAPTTPVDSAMPDPPSPPAEPKAAPAVEKPSAATQAAALEPEPEPPARPPSGRVLRKRPAAVVVQKPPEEDVVDDSRPWTRLTPYVAGVTRYPELQEAHLPIPPAGQAANETASAAPVTEAASDRSTPNDGQAQDMSQATSAMQIAKELLETDATSDAGRDGKVKQPQKATSEAEAASDGGRDGKVKQLAFKNLRSADEFVDAVADYKSMKTNDLYNCLAVINDSLRAWQAEYVGLRKTIDAEYNAPRRRADEPKEDDRISRALDRFKTQGVYDMDTTDNTQRQGPKGFQLRRTLDPRRWVMEIDKDGDQVKADARANDKVMAQAYGFEYDSREHVIGKQEPLDQRDGASKPRTRARPKTLKAAEAEAEESVILTSKRVRKRRVLDDESRNPSRASTPVPAPVKLTRRGRRPAAETSTPAEPEAVEAEEEDDDDDDEDAAPVLPEPARPGRRPRGAKAQQPPPSDPPAHETSAAEEEPKTRKRRRGQAAPDAAVDEAVNDDEPEPEPEPKRVRKRIPRSDLIRPANRPPRAEIASGNFYSSGILGNPRQNGEASRPTTSSSNETVSEGSNYSFRPKRGRNFKDMQDGVEADEAGDGDVSKPKRGRRKRVPPSSVPAQPVPLAPAVPPHMQQHLAPQQRPGPPAFGHQQVVQYPHSPAEHGAFGVLHLGPGASVNMNQAVNMQMAPTSGAPFAHPATPQQEQQSQRQGPGPRGGKKPRELKIKNVTPSMVGRAASASLASASVSGDSGAASRAASPSVANGDEPEKDYASMTKSEKMSHSMRSRWKNGSMQAAVAKRKETLRLKKAKQQVAEADFSSTATSPPAGAGAAAATPAAGAGKKGATPASGGAAAK